MPPDPIVEEVRKVREAYAARFNFDVHAICRDLREKERRRAKQISSGTKMEVGDPVPAPSESQNLPPEQRQPR